MYKTLNPLIHRSGDKGTTGNSERGFPSNGMAAVIATVALVIIASATAGSRAAPIVREFGMISLLASIMAAAPIFTSKAKDKTNG